MAVSEKKILFQCPKCGEKLSIRVNLSELEFEGGIASMTLLHGNPPHTVVIYLDTNGEVRGVEVPEVTLLVEDVTSRADLESSIAEALTIDPKDLYNAFGDKLLTVITLYVMSDSPVYFVVREEEGEIVKLLKDLAKLVNTGVTVERNKILAKAGFSIIDSKFYLINEKEILKGLVYYTLTKKMRGHQPKSKFFAKFVKKYFTKKGNIGEAITQIQYYKTLTKTAYDKIKTLKRIHYRTLQTMLNLSSKDMEILFDCLQAKGIVKKEEWLHFEE